jgi:co-chaperonin GroES (HSP10)
MEPTPTIIKGFNADLIPAEWTGKDTSGIRPIGPIVIVAVDVCSPVSRGGVHLIDDEIFKQTHGSERGVIVALGAGAFLCHEDGTAWRDYRPRLGDRVYFEKFAGTFVRGKDERQYRVMDYKSIGAIYEPDPESKKAD